MPQIFFMVYMAMNLSLLMITLITKKVSIDGFMKGNKSCLKTFHGRKFRQRRAKSVHAKMALPCILNKTAVTFSTQQ